MNHDSATARCFRSWYVLFACTSGWIPEPIETVVIVVGDAMALDRLGSLKDSNKSISVDRLLCVATRNVPDPGSSDAHQPPKTARRNQTTPKTKRQ